MTLRNFLDAAYVVLADEYRRIGTDLQTALKELEIYRAGGPREEPELQPGEAAKPRPSQETQTARENQQALSQLQQMMSATSFGG
jgi:hypothetical protein